MKIDPDQNHNGGGILRSKVAGLERRLMEDKQRHDQRESQLELTQEADKYRRDCLSLRGAVAMLEEDRRMLRKREQSYQETIKVLLEDIESKEREFVELKMANRDLECGKKEAQDEAHEYRSRCCELEAQLSKLANETALQLEMVEEKLKEKFVALAAQNIMELDEKAASKGGEGVVRTAKGMEYRELESRILRLVAERFHLVEKKGDENVKVKEESVDEIGGKPAHEIDDKMPKRTAEYSAPRKSSEKGKEYGELESRILRLVVERFHLVGKEKAGENVKVKEESVDEISGNPAHEVDDKMPKRTVEYSAPQKSFEKDFISSSDPKRKRVSVVINIDSDGERGSCDSVEEEDKITLCEHINKRIEEVAKGAKKELGSSSLQQPCEFRSNGVKLTSSEVAAVKTPLGSAFNKQKKSNGSCRLKKKVKRSDFSCSSTARNPGSTDCSGVAGEVGRHAYPRRNFKNQTSDREYTGRTPAYEQVQHAKWKAETIKRTLKSCNPSFSKSMVQSHVSGSFWFGLPTKFCQDNLPSREMQMILEDEEGVEYEVKCLGNRTALSGGWRGFALAHKLELGDVLIFELSAPTRFKIYIIKAIPEESSKGFDESVAGTEPADGTNKWADVNTTENQDVDLSFFTLKPPKADLQTKVEVKQE